MKVGATGLGTLLVAALAAFLAAVAFAGPVDSDGDGVVDDVDNCLMTPNPSQNDSDADSHGDACDNCLLVSNVQQIDTNSDGCGNQCDPDVNNDGVVGGPDFTLWAADFGFGVPPASPDNDFSGGPGGIPDGVVGGPDFTVFSGLFGGPTGPGLPPDTDCDGDGTP